MKKRTMMAVFAALLATAVGVQAQVTVSVNSTGSDSNATWTITDLNAISPSVSGEGNPGASGFFSAITQLEEDAEIGFTFTPVYDYDVTAASNAIVANSFADYVSGLTSSNVILSSPNTADWGINSFGATTNESNGTAFSENEALIIEISTTNIPVDLIVQDMGWSYATLGDRCDIYIYDASSNTVTLAIDNWRPQSFTYTGDHSVNDGDIILIGTRAQVFAWGGITFDIPSFTDGVVPPINLSAVASNSLVTLDWLDDPSAELDYYNIYRRTDTNVAYSTTPYATSITSSFYQDFGVTNGTTYYYKATTVDVNTNETIAISEVSATPFIPTPTGLSAVGSDGEVVLDWDDSVDYLFESFLVYRSTESGSNYTAIASNFTESAYSDTDPSLVNGTTYYYAVAQKDTNGAESDKSAEASATPNVPPTGLVYQDLFDGDGIDVNTGTGGGLTAKVVAGGPNWNDNGGDLTSNTANNNNRGYVYSTNTFNLAEGFILEVVFNVSANGGGANRFSFGLLDAGSSVAQYGSEIFAETATDFSSVSKGSDAYGIGAAFLTKDTPGLYFIDGASSTRTRLVTNGTDGQQITANTSVTMTLTVDPDGNYSYNLSNNAQTTASTGTVSLALGQYRFVAYHQDKEVSKVIESVTLTAGTELLSGYDAFVAKYSLVEGPSGDDDKDGVSNLGEYALNGNPTNAADTGQTSLSTEGSTFTYVYASNAVDGSLVYRLLDTTDLVAGTENTNSYLSQNVGPVVDDYASVTNTYNMTNDTLFVELEIEK